MPTRSEPVSGPAGIARGQVPKLSRTSQWSIPDAVDRWRVRAPRSFMALKPSGSLAPGVDHVKPVTKTSRQCTGAKSMTGMDMTVITDFTIGLEASAAEADLYLHWAGDLLARAKDDDDGNG